MGHVWVRHRSPKEFAPRSPKRLNYPTSTIRHFRTWKIGYPAKSIDPAQRAGMMTRFRTTGLDPTRKGLLFGPPLGWVRSNNSSLQVRVLFLCTRSNAHVNEEKITTFDHGASLQTYREVCIYVVRHCGWWTDDIDEKLSTTIKGHSKLENALHVFPIVT